MEQPTDHEDRAFWSFLLISQILAATGRGWWMALPWFGLCLWVRAPYWFKLLKKA